MKTMYICICSGFYEHRLILSKFGMRVSLVYIIIENKNRVKNHNFGGQFLVEILQYTKNLENFHIPA